MKRLNSPCTEANETEMDVSSRDAVESSIEISKGNKSMTWDRAAELLDKIGSWETTSHQKNTA